MPISKADSDNFVLPSTSRLYMMQNCSSTYRDHRRRRMSQLRTLRQGILVNDATWKKFQLALIHQKNDDDIPAITNSAIKMNLLQALENFIEDSNTDNRDEIYMNQLRKADSDNRTMNIHRKLDTVYCTNMPKNKTKTVAMALSILTRRSSISFAA
jgi:hypothetical protein